MSGEIRRTLCQTHSIPEYVDCSSHRKFIPSLPLRLRVHWTVRKSTVHMWYATPESDVCTDKESIDKWSYFYVCQSHAGHLRFSKHQARSPPLPTLPLGTRWQAGTAQCLPEYRLMPNYCTKGCGGLRRAREILQSYHVPTLRLSISNWAQGAYSSTHFEITVGLRAQTGLYFIAK